MKTILATITLVPTENGGRRTPIFSGYRGQFYFEGEDFECRRIDLVPDCEVLPGETIDARIQLSEYATAMLVESGRISPGKVFELHEGRKSIAGGVVTGLLQMDSVSREMISD